jgi:glycosyltransferase involved in cell wall biosynthesis
MPKVSVIIPTYNRAQMLCDAIDSALNQTFRNREVIVVDDGSTDETEDVLRARYGDRIRYRYQENQGRAAARNRGIDMASGEYLVFLDSDDWLLPHALEVQTAYLDHHPSVDVVYGDGYYCDKDRKPLQRISLERPAIPEDGLAAIMVLHNIIVATHSAMVRRQALEKLDHPAFDIRLEGTEDADFWLRLTARGATFASHDDLICQYRIHEGNSTSPALSRERRIAMQQLKRKIFKADYFPRLPQWAQWEFMRQLLLVFFDQEPRVQDDIIASAPFHTLPRSDQGRLLYYLGVETVTCHKDLARGRELLRRAAQLGASPRSRLALALSYPRGIPLSWAITLRRWRQKQWTDYNLAPHWRGVAGG